MPTTDGDTAQIGPQVAEMLGITQVTYVRRLTLKGKRSGLKGSWTVQ